MHIPLMADEGPVDEGKAKGVAHTDVGKGQFVKISSPQGPCGMGVPGAQRQLGTAWMQCPGQEPAAVEKRVRQARVAPVEKDNLAACENVHRMGVAVSRQEGQLEPLHPFVRRDDGGEKGLKAGNLFGVQSPALEHACVPQELLSPRCQIRAEAEPADVTGLVSRRVAVLRAGWWRRVLVLKEVERGRLLEALGYYHTTVLEPLTELLRLRSCPEKHDYGLKHLYRDLPADAVRELEALYSFVTLAELRAAVARADALFETVYSNLAQG